MVTIMEGNLHGSEHADKRGAVRAAGVSERSRRNRSLTPAALKDQRTVIVYVLPGSSVGVLVPRRPKVGEITSYLNMPAG